MSFTLSSKFTYWLHELEGENQKPEEWCENLKAVANMETSKDFWQFMQYLKKTHELGKCDMYLFKHCVAPKWEDASNRGGGCFKIRVDKKKSNKLWQYIMMAMISPRNKHIGLMNGLRIKLRYKVDQIQIWVNKEWSDREKLQGLKAYLKDSLNLTEDKLYTLTYFK